MEDRKDKRIVIVTVVGFVLLFAVSIIVTLITLLPRVGKVEVYVRYAPFIAEVTLNDEVVGNNKKTFLEKGEYNVKVSLDGFKTLEQVVTVDDTTKVLYGSITATSEEGKKIANEHINDYSVIQSLIGEKLNKEGEENAKKWPMINKLPVKNSLYSLGYIVENGDITLTVSAYAAYVDTAVAKLTEVAKSIDERLERYNIVFKDYDPQLASKFVNNNNGDPVDYIKYGFRSVNELKYVSGEQSGEYYCAKVSTGMKEHYNLVHNRLILKKNEAGWILVSAVSPILTVYNAQDVPEDVISMANSL